MVYETYWVNIIMDILLKKKKTVYIIVLSNIVKYVRIISMFMFN